MIVIIMLFLILSTSFGIKIKLKVKEEEAILISFFGTVIFAYILGLVNLLKVSIYIIPIISIASLIYSIIKLKNKEEKIQDLITLPTIIYCIGMFLIYYVVKDTSFKEYDEFMFWGTNLKAMIDKNVLWANYQIDGIHLVYPPFTAVAEYIFCKYNGGFSEQISYFAIISLMFTALMPLFKKEKYKIKSLLKILIIILITYTSIIFFEYNIANLSVDCILAIMLAIGMYLAYDLKEKKDYIALTIILIATTLIKTNGALLAGIIVMQIFFRKTFEIIITKEKSAKSILKKYLVVILLLATIVSSYGIWKIYYTVNGKQIDDRHDKNYPENIDIVELFNAMISSDQASTRNKDIVTSFTKKLVLLPISLSSKCNTVFGIFEISNIVFIILLITSKKKKRLFANTLSMNIGLVLYTILNLIIFMFVFQDYQGETQLGFERYMQTYMLAMVLDIIYLLSEKSEIANFLAITVILLLMQKNLNIEMYDPRTEKYTINSYLIECADEINELVSKDEKVFIIDQNLDVGAAFVQLRYLISPIQTNLLYEWNIGYLQEGIFYKMEIEDNELMDKLINEEYDYVYIISINKKFLEEYNSIIDGELAEALEKNILEGNVLFEEIKAKGTLIKIDKENRKLVL